MQAMKDLEGDQPQPEVLGDPAGLASGLTNDGVNILKAAKNIGVTIDVVNIMTMDFYSGSGTEMGQGSVSAAQATLAQMQSVDSGYTYANLGITPMIGKNDDGSTFTLADAQTVESFAAQHGVGRLAFWSVNRDQPCSGSANSLSTCSEISQSRWRSPTRSWRTRAAPAARRPAARRAAPPRVVRPRWYDGRHHHGRDDHRRDDDRRHHRGRRLLHHRRVELLADLHRRQHRLVERPQLEGQVVDAGRGARHHRPVGRLAGPRRLLTHHR